MSRAAAAGFAICLAVACGQPPGTAAGSPQSSSSPANASDTPPAISVGLFSGSSSNGAVSFFVHRVGSTDQLEVDDGDLYVGGYNCFTATGDTASQVNIDVTLLPTPITHSRFDFEQNPVNETSFLMSITVIGAFTSATEVQGTATAVVVAAQAPYTQCAIAPGTVQWSARFQG